MKTTILTLLAVTQIGLAEPAIYRNGVLFIDNGAVDTGTQVLYYQNVYLYADADSNFNFHVLSADTLEPEGQSLEEQTGVYRNGEIRIDSGAVIYGHGVGAYFDNVVLSAASGGGFSVTSAESRSLVTIDSVTVIEVDTVNFPQEAILQIEGAKSRSCVNLEEAAYSRLQNDNYFTLLLAETEVQGEGCAEAPTDFSTSVAIKICNCEPGDYTVNVNDQAEADFTVQ